MKLAVDVGNTTVVIGTFIDNCIIDKMIFPTSKEVFNNIKIQLNTSEDFDEAIYSSVVPCVDQLALRFLTDELHIDKIHVLNSDSKVNFTYRVKNKEEVGADLIADLAGASSLFDEPCLIADLGTATKILLLDKNRIFSNCLITPGIDVSLAAITNKAALLPDVDLSNPAPILECNNTVDALIGGAIYGHVEMIKGIFAKYENALGYKCNKIVTGGASTYVEKLFNGEYIIEPNLVLIGLMEILKINKD